MSLRGVALVPGAVDPFDLYRTLAERYHEPVEEIIRTRLSTRVLTHPDRYEGAKEMIDEILKQSVMRLQKLVPGASVFWDDQVDMPKAYDAFPRVIVDVVDGARNLRGGGTDVTSTLTIEDAKGNMPLAVVSYPFGVERVVDFDGDVYRLPNALMQQHAPFARRRMQAYTLRPRQEKRTMSSIRLAERYDDFADWRRKRIDALREKVRSYTRPVGSISQMMMKVVLESCDVFITKRREPIHCYDYLAATKIIRDLEGCVTDLEGNDVRDTWGDVEGLIVASRKRTHTVFMKALGTR